MSFTDTRDELASILSTVPDVKGYKTRPSVVTPGAAWPLLDVAERGPGMAWSATWRIVVVLSGDELAAQAKLDDLLPLLVDALNPVAYTETARPIALTTSAGDLFAVEITARAE